MTGEVCACGHVLTEHDDEGCLRLCACTDPQHPGPCGHCPCSRAVFPPAGPAPDRLAEDPCEHQDAWFDRSICPEPCGAMHDVCVDCGVIVGGCPLPAIYAREKADRLAEAREAMVRWLWEDAQKPVMSGCNVIADALLALPEVAALLGGERQ